jgi:O-antigen ligase
MIPEHIGHVRVLPPRGSGKRIAVLVVMVLAMGGIAHLLVTGLAASGALGEDVRQKNETQTNSTLGLLLGGRPEILVSSRAVFDSPILGHGSYATDIKYQEMYYDLRLEAGEYPTDPLHGHTEEALGSIPAHSHLMSAWVYAGVFGGIFWGYVFILILRGITRATVLQPVLLPSYSYLFISFVWDVLFSPFGYSERIAEAFLLVAICDLLHAVPGTVMNVVGSLRRHRPIVVPLSSR